MYVLLWKGEWSEHPTEDLIRRYIRNSVFASKQTEAKELQY